MFLPGIKWNRSTKILPTFSNTLSVPRPHFPLSNASATGHPPKLSSNTFVTPRANYHLSKTIWNSPIKKIQILFHVQKITQRNVTNNDEARDILREMPNAMIPLFSWTCHSTLAGKTMQFPIPISPPFTRSRASAPWAVEMAHHIGK